MKESPSPGLCCRIEMRVPSVTGSLAVVRAALHAMGGAFGLCEADDHDVCLAVDEALANVIQHAYAGQSDQSILVAIELRGSAGDGSVSISIEDRGRAVRPEEIRGRALDELRPGGLGVHIIRSVMDDVEYAAGPEGGTILRLGKRLGRHGKNEQARRADASAPRSPTRDGGPRQRDEETDEGGTQA